MRISLLARGVAGTAAAVIASSGIAFALTGVPTDLPEEAQVPSSVEAPAVEPEDAPEGTPGEDAAAAGQEEAEAHQADAEAKRAAAAAFAEQIRAWTACISDNAANSPTPRDEDFDPKDGCEGEQPETTPSGEAFNPGTEDEGADNAPEDAGPPEDAGADGRATAEDNRGDAGPPENPGR